jgi:hypothetical protein
MKPQLFDLKRKILNKKCNENNINKIENIKLYIKEPV